MNLPAGIAATGGVCPGKEGGARKTLDQSGDKGVAARDGVAQH